MVESWRDLTPELLTTMLAGSGVLGAGSVAGVDCEMESSSLGFVSNVARLRLSYTPDTIPGAPLRVFVKWTKPALHPEYRGAGHNEVDFYSRIVPLGSALPIPRCFAAAWDTADSQAFDDA